MDVNLYQTAEAGVTIRDNKQEIMLKYFIFVLEKDEEQKRDWPAHEILICIACVGHILTLDVLMESSFRFDTVNLGWSIVYIEDLT